MAGVYLALHLGFAFMLTMNEARSQDSEPSLSASLTQPATITLMRKSLTEWADDGFPTRERDRGFRTLFESLKANGVFPPETTYEMAGGYDLFQFPQDFEDMREPYFALRKVTSNGKDYRVQFAVEYSKKTKRYAINRITLLAFNGERLDPKSAKEIFDSKDKKKELEHNTGVAKFKVLQCRLSSKPVMDEIQGLISSWLRTQYFPSKDDVKKHGEDYDYQGFRDLFSALKAKGVIHTDTEFSPSFFSGNRNSFENAEAKADPELTLRLEGTRFTYRFDRAKDFKIIPQAPTLLDPACTEDELKKLEAEYLGLRAQFTNIGEKKPDKKPTAGSANDPKKK